MKLVLGLAWMTIFVGSMLACQPFEYGKALDQCAIDHAGDRSGTNACMCAVAQQNGRGCDFLEAGLDGWVLDAGGAQ